MFSEALLTVIRRRLGIRARTDEEKEILKVSGWRDVWIQATCYTIQTWFLTDEQRRVVHEEDKSYGMTLGTRRELLVHIFCPRKMNHKRAASEFPRSSITARRILGTGLMLISNRR